jgi:protein SCO1/2
VAANEPSVPPVPDSLKRLRLLLVGLVVLLIATVATLVALRHWSGGTAAPASQRVAATWAAGETKAPDFALSDQEGRPVSLAALRGRPVVVTFVDPHCTTFCPRESIVLNDALKRSGAADRPAVVAVSVDPKTTSQAVLRKEARRFKWLPQWRWATGSAGQLRAVWSSYHIQVVPGAGDIGHTEAAYLVDASGDQRALYLWPFTAGDIAAGLAQLK